MTVKRWSQRYEQLWITGTTSGKDHFDYVSEGTQTAALCYCWLSLSSRPCFVCCSAILTSLIFCPSICLSEIPSYETTQFAGYSAYRKLSWQETQLTGTLSPQNTSLEPRPGRGSDNSFIPRPRQAFRCLQYISHEHDVINKWQKNSEQKSEVSRIVQPTMSSTLGVYNSHLPLARYVW